MSDPPLLTASGRRKKPDKWANELKRASQTYETLLQTATELEEEKRSLQTKETLLLQVLGSMQALVTEASTRPMQPRAKVATNSSKPPAQDATEADIADHLMWAMVVDTVQQREQEIKSLYGNLLDTLYPCHQRQLQGIEMLKAVCNPDNAAKVCSMTEQQIASRLSVLAGRIALQLLPMQESQPPANPAVADISGPLYDNYMEFSSLIMSSMVWDNSRFRNIMAFNLDTLQVGNGGSDLPAQQWHWLNALKQLQLTDDQMRLLCTLHDMHFWSNKLKLKEALDRNLQQQEAHTAAFTAFLQQQQQPSTSSGTTSGDSAGNRSGDSPASSYPAGFVPVTSFCNVSTAHAHAAGPQDSPVGTHAFAGLGAQVQATPSTSSGQDPMMQYEQLQHSQEALIEERQQLMRRWLLLGIHMGIVTMCTISTYQQAVFVAASYPSVPRMDLAIAAWQEHQLQLAMQRQQQQPAEQSSQAPRRAAKSTAAAGPSTPAHEM